MWARKVAPDTSLASRANSASSNAAIGRLCTSAVPSGSKTPSPTPSGSRRLFTARLSGASRSQNVAVTRRGAADRPNSRHMPAPWRDGRSGSVVEAGAVLSGPQRSRLGLQLGKQSAQVGQQQVGQVMGEPVTDHDPQDGQVGTVGGQGVGGYQPAPFPQPPGHVEHVERAGLLGCGELEPRQL